MADYLTVAEVYRMQYRLIEMFGGLHGVRDKGAVEAAVFRPQIGYYNSLEEEAAALMESLGNNHGFLDGNKRIAFTAADVFLRRNGFYIEVDALDGHGVHIRLNGPARISLCTNPRLDSPAHQAAGLALGKSLHSTCSRIFADRSVRATQ
jgi:death on curing protein